MRVDPCMVREAQDFIAALDPGSDILSFTDEENTAAVIAVDGGYAVGVAGLTRQFAGLGTVWTAFTDQVRGSPRIVVRGIRRHLELQMMLMDVHRVQIAVHIADVETQRFVHLLGFHAESFMPHYWGQDETAMSYVKFGEHIKWDRPQYQ